MGCCRSSSEISASRLHRTNSAGAFSSLTQAEMLQLDTLLSGIPNHGRQAIINLPVHQLLNLYQYHTMALYHAAQREWQHAISYEHRAIKGLQVMLPTDKDHYIFFNCYKILSASFLALGELQVAIEGIHTALAILLKHTPMDYKTISTHYYNLANVYKALKNLKSTAQYLTKAIETAQLIHDLDEKYILMLETELQTTK
jgi:tetratricopeptide (TPR) repeat protein